MDTMLNVIDIAVAYLVHIWLKCENLKSIRKMFSRFSEHLQIMDSRWKKKNANYEDH